MPTNKQSGAALLAFLLIIVTGASYALVRELNASIRRANNGVETAQSLYEAKNALLGWAISHPTYPGTLPMPDRNGDGDYDGDSDCYNGGAIGNNLLLGKLPWREVSSPCKDAAVLPGLRTYALDSSGEQLWYAVSHNLIYETPEYPLISMALLDKNTDWITVRDKNGNVISDRVAFVVIAPGFTNENQDRSSATPAASNYLDSITIGGTCSAGVVTGGTTYDHSDTTNLEYVIYPDAALTDDDCDNFNDQLVFVTIDELMAGLKKRVLSEVSNMLSKYHNTNGALPWLTQFADPKSDIKALEGMTTSSSSNLIDTNMDFSKWGVNAGDIVWNLTDGSRGIVTAVSVNTLTIGAGLFMGVNNAFAIDDEYYVEIKDLSSALNGTATAGSSSFILEDTNSNFEVLDVRIGDVVENITDDSAGIVVSIDNDELTVKELVGGANNTFTNGNVYKLRSNTGTTGANPLILIDANTDFISMGVKEGDLVVNITDSSYGRVATGGVAINELTVDELLHGTTNTFSANDAYAIPRFNGATNTRRGLFSFHKPGEVFHTGFSVDWQAKASDGSTVTSTQPATDPKSLYAGTSNGIKEWVERSESNNSATITVDETDGQCIWVNSTVADCTGVYIDTVFLSGTATSESGEYFYDTSQDFDDAGVYEGDKVENLTNGKKGLVDSASSTGIHFADIFGETAFSITAGDQYRISIASKRTQHTADGNTDTSIYRVYDTQLSSDMSAEFFISGPATAGSTGLVLVDANVDFIALGMEVGKLVYSNGSYGLISSVDSATQLTVNPFLGSPDISFTAGNSYQLVRATSSKITIDDSVVENNSSDGVGLITNFGYNHSMNGYFFEYSPLNGGSENNIDPGDSYNILYDYVDRREYEFKVRINSASSASGGFDEITSNNIRRRNVCLGYDIDCSGSGSNTTIPGDSVIPMVTIRDYNSSDVLVGDARTIVPSAGSTGRVKITGINFLQSENYGDIPGWFVDNNWHQYIYIAYSAGEQPGVGTACTTSFDCLVLNIATNVSNNVRALVMLSGEELSGETWTTGSIGDYVDLTENTDADDIFEKQSLSSTFNDSIRVAISCPSDISKLCWSG